MSSTVEKRKSITHPLGILYHNLSTIKQQEVLDARTEAIRAELNYLSMYRCRVIGRKNGRIEVRKKDGEPFVGNEIQIINEIIYNEINPECVLSEQEDDELYEKKIKESYSTKPDEYRLKAIVEELQNNGFEYEKQVEINTEDYVFVCSRYRLYIQYDDECLIDLPIDEYLHTSIIEYFENEHYGFLLGV